MKFTLCIVACLMVSSEGEVSRDGWKSKAFALEEGAMGAYDAEDWKGAAAQYAQSQMAYVFSDLGYSMAGGLKDFLLEETDLAREFLELVSPHDDHEDVYRILDVLYGHGKERFQAYPRVAMAIGLVFDQKPPRRWPHSQVSEEALPRRLPEPTAAFDFWIDSERAGKMLFPLEKLMIEELKYVVDAAAPFEDLKWAQNELRLKPSSIQGLYLSVAYDDDRYAANQTKWLGEDYRLQTIRERGGICTDQAYYLTQVAKAHGVPCIAVTGVVEDGLHAWTGFMEAPGKWNFQAGRNPESDYVTGRAFDPQTWRRPLDHELAFLKERLASHPRYRLSRLHSTFASLAMREGDFDKAIGAAKEAVKEDKRNLKAWETLIEASESRGDTEGLEPLCRNAAKAFRKYPDLEAGFLRRLAALLEKRGDVEGAKRARKEIIRSNQRDRPDLALAEAARELEMAMRESAIDEQVRLYKRHVTKFRKAGLITGHRMVEPFVKHLIREGESDLAKGAIEHARKRLEVGIPEQLERMLASLEQRL